MSYQGSSTSIPSVPPLVPRAVSPEWLAEELILDRNAEVVIIDDDLSIHQVWQTRLGDQFELHHFQTLSEVRQELGRFSPQAVYLVDWEIRNDQDSGLDFINNYLKGKRAYLVTSHFMDAKVVRSLSISKTQVISKFVAPFIQIKHIEAEGRAPIILIDDDSLVHDVWKAAACATSAEFFSFHSVNDFLSLNAIRPFPIHTKIYIDSSLENGIKGEIVAEDIFKAGFANIFLETGHNLAHYQTVPWIKAVVGKEPPPEMLR